MWQYNYTIQSNDLYHGKYKYLRKEPDGKGGYRYIYRIETGKNRGVIAEKVSGGNDSQYGEYVRRRGREKEVYIKRRNKSLFGSSKFKYKTDNNMGVSTVHTESDSLTKQAVYDTGRAIKKGAKKVQSLLKKMKKKLS